MRGTEMLAWWNKEVSGEYNFIHFQPPKERPKDPEQQKFAFFEE